MLVLIGGQMISTDQIRRIVDQLPDAQGRPRVKVMVCSGDAIVTHGTVERLQHLCGTIIPAQPGYQVIEAYEPWSDLNETQPAFQVAEVIAFRLTGQVDWPVMPITHNGEPDPAETLFGLRSPTGKVRDDETEHETVEAFRASMSRRIAERVRERAEKQSQN